MSQVRLALAEWTVFLTNVPAELLALREALNQRSGENYMPYTTSHVAFICALV